MGRSANQRQLLYFGPGYGFAARQGVRAAAHNAKVVSPKRLEQEVVADGDRARDAKVNFMIEH
ncbi:hypothetical protein D3C71_2084550 [compost metagenome]